MKRILAHRKESGYTREDILCVLNGNGNSSEPASDDSCWYIIYLDSDCNIIDYPYYGEKEVKFTETLFLDNLDIDDDTVDTYSKEGFFDWWDSGLIDQYQTLACEAFADIVDSLLFMVNGYLALDESEREEIEDSAYWHRSEWQDELCAYLKEKINS